MKTFPGRSRREEAHFFLVRAAKLLPAILIGTVAGLSIGFFLRLHSSRATPITGAPTLTTNSVSHPHPQKLTYPAPNTALAKLESDLSMASGVTRWLYWFEALENAHPADFPRLLQLAQGNPLLIRILATRAAQDAPRQCFDLLVAAFRSGDTTHSLPEFAWRFLMEWTHSDPHAVIDALDTTKNFGHRDMWRMDVAGRIFEVDPELGLQQMSRWHIDDFSPSMDQVQKWAAVDPRHAAEFTLNNPSGSAGQAVMEEIGKQWANSDPTAALDFAAGRKSELASTLASTVLLNWAGRDLAASADWLAHADPATRNTLASPFTQAWAKQHPEDALAWSEENLAGTALARAVGGVLKGAAEKDVPAAAALVLELEPSAARAEGALAVAQKWMPRPFDDDGPRTVSPELTTWLSQLDSASLRRVLQEVTWNWTDSDPKGLAAFLLNASPDAIPWHTYSQTAITLAQREPAAAMEWAERLPADQRIGVGAVAFAQWQRSQPEPAMSWLNTLPPDDPRRQPYFENGIRWMAWDSQALDQVARLNESDQTTARRIIQNMDLREDRRTQLLSALQTH